MPRAYHLEYILETRVGWRHVLEVKLGGICGDVQQMARTRHDIDEQETVNEYVLYVVTLYAHIIRSLSPCTYTHICI